MEIFLAWVFLGLFTCSSCLALELPKLSCNPDDALALKEFAGNLTAGSILSAWNWSDNGQSCCTWAGVICENVTGDVSGSSSRVTKLLLSNHGLNGPIPPSLARLDQLVRLDLSFNQLKGELPVQFSSLKRLKVLDLSHNLLSGTIWGSLRGLASIQSLNISSNNFTGDMVGFGEFPDLLVFNISNNSFAGQLNPNLCNISPGIHVIDSSRNHFSGSLDALENCSNSLQQLHLDSNSFSGQIPDFIYGISTLEQLTVSCNNLSGPLVEKLGKLSRLESLVVYANRFSGPFPDVFGKLSRLEQLVAHSNAFSGQLPVTLSLSSNLRVLDVRNNSLSGPIDLNFTNLPHLCTLDLASNRFVGPLPSSLSDCHELKVLSVAKNELSGDIPQSFGSLTSLLFLSLSNNSFTNLSSALSVLQHCRNLGTLILTKNFHGEEIPDGITEFDFESLTVLALGNCGLKGKIPMWLLSCHKLQVLDLSWNRIEGSIPPWIGQMDSLFYLDFSNNSITGEIPKSLTELKSLVFLNCSSSPTASSEIPLYVKRNPSGSGLQYNQISSFPPSIYLSNNRINGSIWPEIGHLKELHVLDLSKNNISGPIPGSISNMENLEVLDLSNNNLTGSIPGSLIKLTFLSKFSVANNHLQGPIPGGTQFSGFPNSSFEGNAGLCGMIDSPCGGRGGGGSGVDLNKKDYPPVGNRSGISGKSNILVITITLGLGFALLLSIVLLKMTRRDSGDGMVNEELGSRPHRLSEALESSKLVLFQNSGYNDLMVGDLLKSTNNFNQANIIGCGGFGLVYKAYLPNGTKAAIKRLSGDCGQAEREFQAEVEALSRAQHKNLVSLQGYCRHGNERLLIYSYMENGSLDYWLHESDDKSSILTWDVRLKIAQGAARGLFYLHKVCEPSIVHRDVKSSNILLDDRFEAHLADFGLSRLIRSPYDTHVTTDLVGTLGYIPPEYSQTLTATFRGDVYSFGVVLLELLTGRRPVEVCKGKNCRDLVSWVFQMRSEKRDQEVVDPGIWDKENERQVLEVLSVACNCTDRDPRRRPVIEQVVSLLDGVGVRPTESDHQQC